MLYNWLGSNLVPSFITYFLSFIVLLIGSITDLKTREVPDWVNYGLILSGIGINLLFSAIYSNPSFIINSIVGLAIFFGIAYMMFYAGQWGGGDSKMLMGIGAMIGIDVSQKANQFLAAFFINALFAGAVYGLLYSIFLVFKNKEKFWKEFKRIISEKSVVNAKKYLLAIFALLVIAFFLIKLYYIRILMLSFMLVILVAFYLWNFVKAIEKSAMFKLVEPAKLTEGDWIVRDVYVGREYICGPKDLGIEKKQIRKLIKLNRQGKVKKILIKEGIPFVPSFLIAFIATFIFGNPLLWFI